MRSIYAGKASPSQSWKSLRPLCNTKANSARKKKWRGLEKKSGKSPSAADIPSGIRIHSGISLALRGQPHFPDVQPRLILPNPLTFRAIHVRSRWMGSYVIGRLDGPLLLVYASYEATSVLFITSVHLPYRNALRFLLFRRINELSQPVTCPVWTPKWKYF